MKYMLGSIATGVLLAGCAREADLTLPEMNKDVIYAADVLYSFECELAEAAELESSLFKNKAVRVAFILRGKSNKGGGGSVKVTVPAGLAAFTVDTTLTRGAKATRTLDFRASYDTNELRDCDRPEAESQNLKRISAGLGLAEWANEIAVLERKLKQKIDSDKYTVEFDISNEVKVSSGVKRTHADNDKREFGFVPSGTNETYHQIAVTVTDLKKPTRKPKPKGTAPSSVTVIFPTLDIPRETIIEQDRELDRLLDRDFE